jgi:hypothetical protein
MRLISYNQPNALDVHATKQRHYACWEPGRSQSPEGPGRRESSQENREGNQTHPKFTPL